MEDSKSNDTADVAERVGRLRFLDVSEKGLSPVLTGIGALYLVLAISQALHDPGFRSVPIVVLAMITAGVFFGSRFILTRYTLSPVWAESLGAIFAILVVLNGLVHLYLLSGIQETKSLALLAVGLACFFLPSRIQVLVLAVCLAIWLIVGVFAEVTETWLHFAFGLFVATGLRLHTEFQKTRLLAALSSAEWELQKRRNAELALRESEERYSLAAVGSKDGLWDWDIERDRVYYSDRWKSMLGYSDDEIGNSLKDWFGLVHTDDIDELQDAFSNHLEGRSRNLEVECRLRRSDDSFVWVLVRGMAVRGEDGKAYRMAGSQTDVHDRKLAEQELYEGAFHDPLTGLGNRMLFIERLQMALARAKRQPDYNFAVLFMDLDRFKIINDSLGHLAGDRLLKELAKRLETSLRQVDTVARFGGDEFAVLLDEVEEPDDAHRCAARIHLNLGRPFELAGREVFVSASVGIVLSSKGYLKPEEMLRDADTAMYRAKLEGDSCTQVFDKEMHVQAVATYQLENDLQLALRESQFRLWYQPIVDAKTKRIVSCEALIRWQHPRRGLLAPDRFLAAAEEAGLLVSVGWWVVEEACRTARLWQEQFSNPHPVSVSVNVAGSQFARGDAVERITSILEKSGLDPSSLKLEITEDGVREVAEAVTILKSLQDLGIHLHLDDFGTGYSSLTYLHRLPIDVSKIDRAFISEVDRASSNRDVVRAMVNLMHDLGMEVTVEGVETAEQYAFVRDLGCEYAQGFHFSRPLAPDALWALFGKLDDLRLEPEDSE
jgi:diguanylate cyclase (GGDEF)-like protein/PAS domain S-box-containing protein